MSLWLRAFLNEACKTTFLNSKESAKKAGYNAKSNHVFAVIGCANFRRKQKEIELWLDENGLSKNALKTKLIQLMDIEETKIITVSGKVDQDKLPGFCRFITETETKKYTNDTNDGDSVIEYKTVLAINSKAIETQRKTLDMALKVRGMNAPEKYEHTGGHGGPIENKTIMEAGPEIQKVIDLLEESITERKNTSDEGDNKT